MRLNVSLILILIFSCFSCYHQIPKTSEYDELFRQTEELIREQEELNRQQEEQLKKQFNQYDKLFATLRNECKELKNIKSYSNLISQKYTQDEIIFLSKLNDKQLELYSKFSESLEGDISSKILLAQKRLAKSLNKEQWVKFVELHNRFLTINQINGEYNKRVRDFEDKKSQLIIYTKLIFNGSPNIFEILMIIEEDLSY